MSERTPLELIQIYWERVYNDMEVELVREICADPIVRHDPQSITSLSHDEQIERILRTRPLRPYFTHQVLHADASYVTSVWNMKSRDGRNAELCGIEVFRAENGRFTDCWNSSYMKGRWGEKGDEFDASVLAAPPLVDSAERIDADWLQRAFAAGRAVPVQRIAALGAVTPIGHGTSSTVVRVQAGYNAGRITAPTSAICKIGKLPARAGAAASPFVREARAYTWFGSEPPFRVPRVYYAASDEQGLSNLVLEDLSAIAEPGDQLAGCSVEQAAAVVRELARLHRAYWKSPELDRLDWLHDPSSFAPAYVAGAGVLRDWLGERIPAEAFRIIDGFGRLLHRWLDIPPAGRTLLHGDPRVDNILFERSADGETRACLIDWQTVRSGDPQYDVAYFLSGSLDPRERRACERELIARHANAIAQIDAGYTLETALESYRANSVSGLWLTGVASAFIGRTDHNARLLETLVARNVETVRDWDGLGAIEALGRR
jgi:aminoglycoside/choline kinase family phosphotransferase